MKPQLAPRPAAAKAAWSAGAFELVGRAKVEGLGRFPSDHWGLQVRWSLQGGKPAPKPPPPATVKPDDNNNDIDDDNTGTNILILIILIIIIQSSSSAALPGPPGGAAAEQGGAPEVSCDIHTNTPARKSSTNFQLCDVVTNIYTNCLGHGHGYECHSPGGLAG